MANVVVQLSHAVMTLEQFHDSLRKSDGTETIALRTLEAHACGGRLPGAWKQGGIWMVNMIALLQQGYDVERDAGDPPPKSEEPDEAEAPAARKRNRRDRPHGGRAKVPGQEAAEGIPAPLRFPS